MKKQDSGEGRDSRASAARLSSRTGGVVVRRVGGFFSKRDTTWRVRSEEPTRAVLPQSVLRGAGVAGGCGGWKCAEQPRTSDGSVARRDVVSGELRRASYPKGRACLGGVHLGEGMCDGGELLGTSYPSEGLHPDGNGAGASHPWKGSAGVSGADSRRSASRDHSCVQGFIFCGQVSKWICHNWPLVRFCLQCLQGLPIRVVFVEGATVGRARSSTCPGSVKYWIPPA